MPSHKHGFTLIEMSIVLVIIGLLVGGVLTGRDLIKVAVIRKTITQKEQITVAVNTFLGKYNCLPGDCTNANALAFGFSGGTGTNNGIIATAEGLDDTDTGNGFPGGQYWFWQQLYEAKLLAIKPYGHTGHYMSGYETPDCPICERSYYSVQGFSVGGWSVIDLFANPNKGCGNIGNIGYRVPRFTRALAMTSGNFAGNTNPTVIPMNASMLDQKIDDGKPYTGSVVAIDKYFFAAAGGCTATPGSTWGSLNIPSCTDWGNNTYLVTQNTACFDLLMDAGF